MEYEVIQPPFTLTFWEMPKNESRRYFEWFMQVMPDRIRQLSNAVQASPGFEDWQPNGHAESLNLLGEWFANQVTVRPRTEEEIKNKEAKSKFPIEIPREELTSRTFSLAMDVGMYLSQVFLENHPSLKWELPLSSQKFIDYGQPVLVKFRTAPFNPVRMIVTFAYGVAQHTKNGDGMKRIYEIWSKQIVLD